jgi:hypothetical protein
VRLVTTACASQNEKAPAQLGSGDDPRDDVGVAGDGGADRTQLVDGPQAGAQPQHRAALVVEQVQHGGHELRRAAHVLDENDLLNVGGGQFARAPEQVGAHHTAGGVLHPGVVEEQPDAHERRCEEHGEHDDARHQHPARHAAEDDDDQQCGHPRANEHGSAVVRPRRRDGLHGHQTNAG